MVLHSGRDFFRSIVHNFGWHFAILLVSVYTCLKGFIFQMATSAMLPYFKNLGVTGDKYQSYGTVAQTPWALKAAIGLLSDTVPFYGYHKTSYILLVSVFGTICLGVLGSVQFTPYLAPLAALLLLLAHLQLAVVDLLCEGKYAEMMVSKPESGSDLVTYVWGLYMAGTFLGSLIAGPMADHVNPRYIFLVCLPLAAQVILPVAAGWLPETSLPPGQRGIRRDKINAHPDLFKLSVLMTAGALVVGGAALFGTGKSQSILSLITAFILCVYGMRWLPPMLKQANLFMFLSSMLYVSLPGALDYWFTGSDTCVPNGPHFSFTYYVTYASLVGSLAGGIGVAAFQRFLSRGNFRTAFWTTCLVKLAASFFDIFIVKRYNLRFGIPDKVAFMLGDAVLFQVAYTLNFMPAVVLTSKVCPKGMEASVYALLASYQNLGSNVSRTVGVALIDYLGIKTTAPCNFTNLPMAIFIAHVSLPLLVFPLVFVLIPDAKMTDNLLREERGRTEHGSEFTRLPSQDVENLVEHDEFLLNSPQTRQDSQPVEIKVLDFEYPEEIEDQEEQNIASSEPQSIMSNRLNFKDRCG
ncbi:unnamed protein product [Chondrus crispus]|uniref:Uncharacterized protein n=1 Tax=Chondrus crispus TaxID=2769 RepID=R7QCZ6_CHOCR|nr:unnamed protein product [Chondrus crispus]CDF36377.1 unnamed protein product [Chondrus crispus]|eukprot:XP_005716196.1 unnamed protein product [Chondrus crispus]